MGFPIGGEIKCTSSPSSVLVSVSFCDIQYEDRFVAIILNSTHSIFPFLFISNLLVNRYLSDKTSRLSSAVFFTPKFDISHPISGPGDQSVFCGQFSSFFDPQT